MAFTAKHKILLVAGACAAIIIGATYVLIQSGPSLDAAAQAQPRASTTVTPPLIPFNGPVKRSPPQVISRGELFCFNDDTLCIAAETEDPVATIQNLIKQSGIAGHQLAEPSDEENNQQASRVAYKKFRVEIRVTPVD